MRRRKEQEPFIRAFGCFAVACVVLAVAFWAGVIFVAAHFIGKWW